MTIYLAPISLRTPTVTRLVKLAGEVRFGVDMKMGVPAVSAAGCENQTAFTFAGELIASCGDNGLGGQKL